jgi:cytochrome c
LFVYDKAARKMGDRLGFCGALLVAQIAGADAAAPRQADRWCDAVQAAMRDCHFTKLSEPVRQGGRPAGKVDGFHYSAGFAKADFAWDDARLHAWLANPEAIIPGAIVAYRQPKAKTRAAIIAYLKEMN